MKKLLITIDGTANDEASLKSAMLAPQRLKASLNVVFTVLPSQSVFSGSDVPSAEERLASNEQQLEWHCGGKQPGNGWHTLRTY